MTTYYRFRPLSRLLGDEGELETQTLYFAGPSELNDPMEGFTEIVFRGDRIVWENFFRHFIHCLGWAATMYRVVGEQRPVDWTMIPWFDPGQGAHLPLHETVTQTADGLIAEPSMQRLLDHLSRRHDDISEDEVATYLIVMHQVWLLALLEAVSPGILPEELRTIRQVDLEPTLAMLEENQGTGEEAGQVGLHLRAMFDTTLAKVWEASLVDRLTGTMHKGGNFQFVVADFVNAYLRQVRKLMYPDWHAACFMDSCSNASVWGHYANGHAAVCLKFGATPWQGRDALVLATPSRPDGPKRWETPRAFPFHPVAYTPNAVRLNFFESLGRLTPDVLTRTWRTNRMGQTSPLVADMSQHTDAWRARFWAEFERSVTTKAPDWEYEREHRLTYVDTLRDLSTPATRVLRYDFMALEGVVFGIRTPDRDKVEIIQRIQKKCRQHGRAAFAFSQAIRTPDGNGIGERPLPQLSAFAWDHYA